MGLPQVPGRIISRRLLWLLADHEQPGTRLFAELPEEDGSQESALTARRFLLRRRKTTRIAVFFRLLDTSNSLDGAQASAMRVDISFMTGD